MQLSNNEHQFAVTHQDEVTRHDPSDYVLIMHQMLRKRLSADICRKLPASHPSASSPQKQLNLATMRVHNTRQAMGRALPSEEKDPPAIALTEHERGAGAVDLGAHDDSIPSFVHSVTIQTVRMEAPKRPRTAGRSRGMSRSRSRAASSTRSAGASVGSPYIPFTRLPRGDRGRNSGGGGGGGRGTRARPRARPQSAPSSRGMAMSRTQSRPEYNPRDMAGVEQQNTAAKTATDARVEPREAAPAPAYRGSFSHHGDENGNLTTQHGSDSDGLNRDARGRRRNADTLRFASVAAAVSAALGVTRNLRQSAAVSTGAGTTTSPPAEEPSMRSTAYRKWHTRREAQRVARLMHYEERRRVEQTDQREQQKLQLPAHASHFTWNHNPGPSSYAPLVTREGKGLWGQRSAVQQPGKHQTLRERAGGGPDDVVADVYSSPWAAPSTKEPHIRGRIPAIQTANCDEFGSTGLSGFMAAQDTPGPGAYTMRGGDKDGMADTVLHAASATRGQKQRPALMGKSRRW